MGNTRHPTDLQSARLPLCANKKLSVTNNLAAIRPDVAAEYDLDRNPLSPEQILARTNTHVWWTCPQGPDHTWRTAPSTRLLAGTGCPSCAGLQPSITNSLAALHPELAAQLHPTRNEGLTADQIVAKSTRKVWWRCPSKVDHEPWHAMVSNRSRLGVGCPRCTTKISKPQLFLMAELQWIFTDTCVVVDAPDYRIGKYDPDIHLRSPDLKTRGVEGIAVLYDGAHWHLGNETNDLKSMEQLGAANRLVLRARENPLPPLGLNNILMPPKASIKLTAGLIATELTKADGIFLLPSGRTQEYFLQPDLQAVDEAYELIGRYWK